MNELRDLGGRRIVHGTPITPAHLLDQLAGCSFCVSFADDRDIERCIELVGEDEILVLDNGAFSHWRSGKGQINRFKFWEWANEIQARCPQAIAVIPDVIEGDEESNLEELTWALRGAFGKGPLAQFPERTMSIWHMDESQDYLALQMKLMNFIGIGSCAEFDVQRNKSGYLEVMETVRQTRAIIAAQTGNTSWVHAMRGLGVYKEMAWVDSADSCNVARNHNRYRDQDDHVVNFAERIHDEVQFAAIDIPMNLNQSQQEVA
jgi:hypothetical protein